MVTLEFCGAAKTVTGSNYLVRTNKANFLIDCGMFQGPKVENLNLEDFPYNEPSIDFVLLTHAHVDHSGMLPKLYKKGFTGPIYATSDTIKISNELLLDSAKLQENAFQRGEFYGKYTSIKAVVYNTHDALGAINLFKVINYDEPFSPAEGIRVKYIQASHILGAASIEVEIDDDGKTKKITFSGDIGRMKNHIIPNFDLNYRATPQYVIMESLYGGQIHVDRDESTEQLIEIIRDTTKNRGNVFIPCFAVQRAQEVLNDIKNAKRKKTLDEDLPVWLDSPLAQRVTQIYKNALQNTSDDLFDFKNLIYVKKQKQSARLAKMQGQVIIAGSGMADGGRIMDHLSTGLEEKRNSVIFVGFQAEGTMGRELIEGAKNVMFGTKSVKVRASIHHLEGFSAHGDTNDYTAWIQRFISPELSKIFLIHAEPDRSQALKEKFDSMGFPESYIPSMLETIEL